MNAMKGITQWLLVILFVLLLYSLFEQMAHLLKSSVPAVAGILVWYLLWRTAKGGMTTGLKEAASRFSPASFLHKLRLSLAYRRFRNRTKTADNGTIVCKSCGNGIDPFSFGVSGRCPNCGTKIL